jgi:abhydrolase domain-containing protein 13
VAVFYSTSSKSTFSKNLDRATSFNTVSELIYPRNIPLGSTTESGVPRPEQFGISNYEDVQIPTPDGETLAAYEIRPAHGVTVSNTTILMFHGNAGNIGHRLPIAKYLAESNRLNVLMLEYRGYGLSTGSPDEKGLNIDAQAGLDWIRNHVKGNPKVIIYGQSIGGAVSIQLAVRNQDRGDIAGLILENTFLSIRKMIPKLVIKSKRKNSCMETILTMPVHFRQQDF